MNMSAFQISGGFSFRAERLCAWHDRPRQSIYPNKQALIEPRLGRPSASMHYDKLSAKTAWQAKQKGPRFDGAALFYVSLSYVRRRRK